jgi:predicted glycosyltransferase
MKVSIVVTHLLGTGHLARALTLGRAFANGGHQVQVISGGRSASHLDATTVTLVQLPALASDGTNFTRLLDDNGQVVDQQWLDQRKDALVRAVTDHAPDVVITELFPFGRRVLRDEFTALLCAIKNWTTPPLVLSSIRDILAPPSKPQRATDCAAIVDQFYDAVLVHSDPAVIKLDHSWPVTPPVAEKLLYTGFVTDSPPRPHPQKIGKDEILVSAGGGAVGDGLFMAALDAARSRPWLRLRMLVGGSPERRKEFTDLAPQNVIIDPVRPDFRQMMAVATASISMCGYNTAMDLLQTGLPAVIVPFEDGKEVEQSLRSEALALMSGFAIVRSDQLTGATLTTALDQVLSTPKRTTTDLRFDGAEQAMHLVTKMYETRP